VEGSGHVLLDFHVLTKALLNLQVHVIDGLKTGVRRRRRLVGGPGFEKSESS
jgi:hypothetical protein